MGNVVVTIKVMPESPEVNLEAKVDDIRKVINRHGSFGKAEVVPIAFGLKALQIFFVMDEKSGEPDKITEDIKKIDGVENAEIIDVRRDFL